MASQLESPTSSASSSPNVPLKNKLSKVKCLLDDASERLEEEASNYKVFATKTSAVASSIGGRHLPQDLANTMSDIRTLKSVLSCPIFNRIVNVTDALDSLSYQLNLHPSIGPSDVNIDSNGELILTPPIDPTSLNEIISNRLDDYSDCSDPSGQVLSPSNLGTNNGASLGINLQQLKNKQQESTALAAQGQAEADRLAAKKIPRVLKEQRNNANNRQQYVNQQLAQSAQNIVPSSIVSPANDYDTEKLVANGHGKIFPNGNKQRCDRESVAMDCVADGDLQRLSSNSHLVSNEKEIPIRPNSRGDGLTNQPMQGIFTDQTANGNVEKGYSNELYRTTHELSQPESLTIEHLQRRQDDAHNMASSPQTRDTQIHTNGKSSAVQYNRGSCSPSTSVGSTVRVVDECDSGASSYQSNCPKQVPQLPYIHGKNLFEPVQEVTDVVCNPVEDEVEDTVDQELIENLAPDMEKIKVTLEKDNNGLGITVAGYTKDHEEISGIFIRSIIPGSPAYRSGKVRVLDQIFAVNGRELLNYTNPEAVNVLRHTGKTVTLELMRYLSESKFKRLESRLSRASPVCSNSPNSSVAGANRNSSDSNLVQGPVSPTKSSIPLSKHRDASNQSPTKANFVQPSSAKTTPQQFAASESSHTKSELVSTNSAELLKSNSSMPKNAAEISLDSPDTPSHIPRAAQRGSNGSSRIIETKQGARNTIDIRSPACQTPPTATYVNKVIDSDLNESNLSFAARLIREAPPAIGQLIRSAEPEWEKEAQIIEIYKDLSQGLGFTVKEYANPRDKQQSIIMITSLTPGGIAERDGRLSVGDVLIFVDDTNLEDASLNETVKALKNTNGQVRLGVLKLKRN